LIYLPQILTLFRVTAIYIELTSFKMITYLFFILMKKTYCH